MEIYLPVNKQTKEIDTEYISYMLQEKRFLTHPKYELIDTWEYKKFKITFTEIKEE